VTQNLQEIIYLYYEIYHSAINNAI